MKEWYEEVQCFGKYYFDYIIVLMKMRELKCFVDLYDKVVVFKRVEIVLQKLLDEVSVVIGLEVFFFIKVLIGNLFFDVGGCGGGCGIGGGCGCKKMG